MHGNTVAPILDNLGDVTGRDTVDRPVPPPADDSAGVRVGCPCMLPTFVANLCLRHSLGTGLFKSTLSHFLTSPLRLKVVL